MENGKKIGIKFLLPNSLTGSLIGTGGKAIKELITISDARVIVSNASDCYPGTSDRVILVSGTKEAVSVAQTLLWEMIGLMSKNGGGRENGLVEWNPRTAFENLGQVDEVEVTAKFTVPSLVGGAILGRGGETIRSFSATTNARIAMSSKDEALFTQERVITVSGSVANCIACTDLVLAKLAAQSESIPFANRGTTYSSPLSNTLGMLGGPTSYSTAGGMGGGGHGMMGGGGGPGGYSSGGRGDRGSGGGSRCAPRTGGGGGDRGRGMGGGDRGDRGGGRRGGGGGGADEGMDQAIQPVSGLSAAIADTTITLSVPDELIGNIFGRQGSTMREIISMSRAKIVVSPRGEYVEGTTNRLVTITGSPQAAQTAHLFITQRLHTPSNPPPARGSGGDRGGGDHRRGGGDRSGGDRANHGNGAGAGIGDGEAIAAATSTAPATEKK